MADLYYIDSGYFDPALGYYVYTADAEAAVSSNFTIACTISHIEGADLLAFTDASLTASGNRIRNASANLGGAAGFVCNTDGGIIQTAGANLSSAFTSTITADRIKSAGAAISASFSTSAVITPVKNAELFVASQATIAIVVAKIPQINVALSTSFSANILAATTRALTAEANAFVSLSADSSRTRKNEAALAAAFSLAATISHIEGADIVAFTNATLSVTTRVTRRASADLSDAFVLESSITVTDAAWRTGMWMYGAATEDSVGTVITTANNNDFVYALTQPTSTTLAIVKRNITTGVVDNWAKSFDARNNDNNGVNRPDLVVLGTDLYLSFNRLNSLFLEKLNASGTSQWKVRVSTLGYASYVVTDGTDIYVCNTDDNVNRSQRISKFNTAGTQAWSKVIQPASGWVANISYARERNGYVYLTYSETNTTTGAERLLLAKIQSDGTLVWNKLLPTTFEKDSKVDIDYNDNIWLFSRMPATPLQDNSYVVKFDSTGAEIWTRKWSDSIGALGATTATDTAFDTDNNIYVIPDIVGSSSDQNLEKYIVSLDPSGARRWVRSFPALSTVRSPFDWQFTLNSLIVANQHVLISGNASYNDGTGYSGFAAYDMTIRVLKEFGGTPIVGARLSNNWTYSNTDYINVDAATTAGVSLTTSSRTYSTGSSSSTQSATALTAFTPGNYKWMYVVDAFGYFFSTAAQTASAQRIRTATANLSSVFTQTAEVAGRRGFAAALTSTASVTCVVSYRINKGADLNAAFTQTTVGNTRRGIVIEASAVASISATAKRTRGMQAALTSTATLTAAATRTRLVTTDFQAIATNLTVAVKQAFFGSEITASASLTLLASKLTVTPINLSVVASLTAQPDNRLRSPTVSLSTTATLTANTANSKVVRVTADLNAVTSVQATTKLTAKPSIALNATAQLTTSALVLVLIQANLSAQSTVTAAIGVIKQGQITLQATGFILAIGDRIVIDPALKLVIEPETRRLVIVPEDRALIIESETRTLVILEETRLMLIEQSTGVNTMIKG